jgi:hypothetical protein
VINTRTADADIHFVPSLVGGLADSCETLVFLSDGKIILSHSSNLSGPWLAQAV